MIKASIDGKVDSIRYCDFIYKGEEFDSVMIDTGSMHLTRLVTNTIYSVGEKIAVNCYYEHDYYGQGYFIEK